MSLTEILDYEIRSSWWASLISNDYLQDLAGSYFAKKAKIKYSRYLFSKKMQKEMEEKIIANRNK